MSISPIGINSNNDKTSFGQFLFVKKPNKWAPEILDAFQSMQSVSLKRMLQSNDVVVRQVSAKSGEENTKLYNVVFSLIPENSLLGQLADKLHLIPRYKLSDTFKPAKDIAENMNEQSMLGIYDKINKV
jgi:hypothetical protein